MKTLRWILTWTLLAVTFRPIGAAEADSEKRLQAARRLATEDLAEPVKSVREGMLLWVPNPDGKTWDLLQVYFPQYGGPNTIVVIDLGTGEVKQVFSRAIPCPLPVAIGSDQQETWDFRLGPDGRVWTFLQGVLVRIDPAEGSVEVVGRPPIPGRIAFAGGSVYLGGTTAIRRIAGLTVTPSR